MKAKLFSALLLVAIMYTTDSCSSDASEADSAAVSSQIVNDYIYNSTELETMSLINAHRTKVGLSELKIINHISFKSEEHDEYMITNNVVNHDDFVARSENIIKVLGAKNVGENIAYNYTTPQSAVDAWLRSQGHKENIEGDYTHFGISVRENPINGKKYYTNIFVKI